MSMENAPIASPYLPYRAMDTGCSSADCSSSGSMGGNWNDPSGRSAGAGNEAKPAKCIVNDRKDENL